MEAAKLMSTHPGAAQDIESKRLELEESWAGLREQVARQFINSYEDWLHRTPLTFPFCSF